MTDRENGTTAKVPVWIMGIVLPAVLGLIIVLWQKTDAKAEEANRRSITTEASAVAFYSEILRRLDRIERKLDQQ